MARRGGVVLKFGMPRENAAASIELRANRDAGRVLGPERSVRHEEFREALHDARGRTRDALNGIDDDGRDLAQRIEILQTRIQDEEGER